MCPNEIEAETMYATIKTLAGEKGRNILFDHVAAHIKASGWRLEDDNETARCPACMEIADNAEEIQKRWKESSEKLLREVPILKEVVDGALNMLLHGDPDAKSRELPEGFELTGLSELIDDAE